MMHFDVRGCWRFMFCVYFSRTRNCIFRSKELYFSREMICKSVQILVLRTFLTQGGKTSVKVDANQDAKDEKYKIDILVIPETHMNQNCKETLGEEHMIYFSTSVGEKRRKETKEKTPISSPPNSLEYKPY